VEYGPGPARFAGATYDFTSHYRGAAVFKFFKEQGLTVEKLRELSQHQVRTLAPGLAFEPDVPITGLAGFLAFPSAEAPRLHEALKQEGIGTDYRGATLRLGPAPYLTDNQLCGATAVLRDARRRAL
jgi:selenocysteine lyase/cysteine desulfurase